MRNRTSDLRIYISWCRAISRTGGRRLFFFFFPFFSVDMLRPVQQIKWEQSKVSNNCSVQSTIWRIGGPHLLSTLQSFKKKLLDFEQPTTYVTQERGWQGVLDWRTIKAKMYVTRQFYRKASVFRKFITSARRHPPPRQIHDWRVSSFFSWKPKDFLETLPTSGKIWSLVALLVRDA